MMQSVRSFGDMNLYSFSSGFCQARVDECQAQLKMVQTQLLTVTEEAERLKPMLREKRDVLSAAKQALRAAQVQCLLLGCCAHEQGWGNCLCGEAEGLLGWDYCGGGGVTEVGLLWRGGVTVVGLLWRGRGY